MAAILQKQGKIELDDAAGTLQDITSTVKGGSLKASATATGFFVLGSADNKAGVGGRETTGEIVGYVDLAANSGYDVCYKWMSGTSHDAARTLQQSIPDDQTGSLQMAAEVKINGEMMYSNIVAGEGAPQEYTLPVMADGGVTFTVIS